MLKGLKIEEVLPEAKRNLQFRFNKVGNEVHSYPVLLPVQGRHFKCRPAGVGLR
jgi:hypothetical protein